MISTANNTIARGDVPHQGHVKANADRVLSLAAAPVFATMALLTALDDSGMPNMICSAAHGASSLTGMIPMYLLMSAFHAGPWLKLLLARHSRGATAGTVTATRRVSL